MGRVSLYSVRASELALADAGLAGDASIADGRMGVAYGSSSGSVEPIRAFGTMLATGSMSEVTSNSYVQMMPHTSAVNVGVFFGPERADRADVLRVHVGQPGDRLRLRGDRDRQAGADARGRRGGTFGAGGRGLRHALCDQHTQRRAVISRRGRSISRATAWSSAKARRRSCWRNTSMPWRAARASMRKSWASAATPTAVHITQPTAATMARAMQLALDDARLAPGAIALRQCARHRDRPRRRRRKPRDRADLRRTDADQLAEELRRTYARRVRRARSVVDDRDDEAQLVCADAQPDPARPACASLDYIMHEARAIDAEYVMSNNFAFGGINTSLIFRRVR